MDWDIAPDEFNEFVTIGGTGTTPICCTPATTVLQAPIRWPSFYRYWWLRNYVDFTDCGPTDHGALFDFGFGDLADGEELTFSIFYGGAADEADCDSGPWYDWRRAVLVRSMVRRSDGWLPGNLHFRLRRCWRHGHCSRSRSRSRPDPDPDPTTVPEPTTLALMGIGLLGLGLRRRKKV